MGEMKSDIVAWINGHAGQIEVIIARIRRDMPLSGILPLRF